MAKVTFLDDVTIEVVALDGENFTFKTFLPEPKDKQRDLANAFAFYFDEYFSDDKTSMVYWVSIKMAFDHGLTFHYYNSDRSEERQRIGSRIRQLREGKGMEAKALAKLANIDAANFSRIEQGMYSTGLDILSRIAQALGVKVDLV